MKSMRAQNTHVSRVSTKESWNENASTPSKLRYESTISQFHCAESHERYCDSPMGLGETAIFECLAVICYLKGVIKLSALLVISGTIGKHLRFDLSKSLEIFCTVSTERSDKVVILHNQTDPELHGHFLLVPCLLVPCRLILDIWAFSSEQGVYWLRYSYRPGEGQKQV